MGGCGGGSGAADAEKAEQRTQMGKHDPLGSLPGIGHGCPPGRQAGRQAGSQARRRETGAENCLPTALLTKRALTCA